MTTENGICRRNNEASTNAPMQNKRIDIYFALQFLLHPSARKIPSNLHFNKIIKYLQFMRMYRRTPEARPCGWHTGTPFILMRRWWCMCLSFIWNNVACPVSAPCKRCRRSEMSHSINANGVFVILSFSVAGTNGLNRCLRDMGNNGFRFENIKNEAIKTLDSNAAKRSM